MAGRLGWFPATIDFAQKLPYTGEFLLTAGITDTAHLASGLHAQCNPSSGDHFICGQSIAEISFFFSFRRGEGGRTFDGRSIVPLPISYSVR